MSAIEYRLAEAADIPGVTAISNDAILHGRAHFGTETVSDLVALADWETWREKYPLFVARDGAEVVGFAKASKYRERAAYTWSTELGVYVRASHQGRGIGGELYARLLPVLRAQGYREAIAGIALPNPASVALHERIGMRCVGTLPRIGYKLGMWLDVGFWMMPLGPIDDGAPGAVVSVSEALRALGR